jgi:hypothetical protein
MFLSSEKVENLRREISLRQHPLAAELPGEVISQQNPALG